MNQRLDVECPNFPKLTERGPYFNAPNIKHRKVLNEVFNFLSKMPNHGVIMECSIKTGISRTTLLSWKKQLQKDLSWRPWKKHTNQNKMILTAEEEFAIVDEIEQEFFNQGLFCPQKILKAKCLKTFNDRNQDPNKNFRCSYGYLKNIRRRTKLSLRKPILARRPEPNDEEIQTFINDLTNAYAIYDRDHILNMDETSVRLIPHLGLTLAKRGAKKAPNHILGNVKKCFTATCTISAGGKKYPIWFIGKGVNQSCLNVFGDRIINGQHQTSFSASGWMDKKIMKLYLEWLSDMHNNSAICLVMDRYSAHIDGEVLQHASDHNIEIIFVPSGLTSEYQPLDRKVYGVVKMNCSDYWMRNYIQDLQYEASEQIAAEQFIKSFNSVSRDTVLKAWKFDFLEE